MIPELFACHCLELCPCDYKFKAVIRQRDEALAAAEAYRDAGVKILREECEAEYGLWGNPDIVEAYKELDELAARIMKEKGDA